MEDILRKLEKLREYTEILSVAAAYSKRDFVEMPLIFGGAERFILLGYENILETCKLTCKHCNLRDNLKDREIIKELELNRVFPQWLGVNLNKRVMYIYTLEYDFLRYMSKEELYTLLDDIISDFRHFRKYLLEYIL